MARTNIPGQTPVGPFPAGGTVSAAALDLTMTAADTSMHNKTPFTGRDILLVQNTDSASHNLTITSAPDEHGRSSDIASYAVGAGKISAFSLRGGAAGWLQSDGNLYYQGDSAMLFFAVLSTPS
jgi:hypothetical protein